MRSSTLSALLAAQTTMAAAGMPLMGEFASYNVTAHNVERTVIRDVFARAGYGTFATACIPKYTPVQALGNAISQIKPPKGLAVLPVRQLSDGCQVEFAIWRGNPDSTSKGTEVPVMGARVSVNSSGAAEFLAREGVALPLPEDSSTWTDEQAAVSACLGFARSLAVRANRIVRYVETNDVTQTLQNILTEKMFGAKFSDHGRGHFILAAYAEKWHKLMDALAPFGVEPVILPIYKDGCGDVTTATAAKDDFASKILQLRKDLQEVANKGGKRGPRQDSLERRVQECIALVNQANMYAEILGSMKDAVVADTEAVKKLFKKLQDGGRVTYGAADVDAPLLGEAQIHEDEQTDPQPVMTEPGVKVLPSAGIEAAREAESLT